jgi:hypothetical protein
VNAGRSNSHAGMDSGTLTDSVLFLIDSQGHTVLYSAS